jgi:hypothetical protein
MKFLRALRRKILTPVDQGLARGASAQIPGTRAWLVRMEHKFGGFVKNVPRHRASPADHRTPGQLARGGMIGGDRMGFACHGYGGTYSRYLLPFVGAEPLVLVEAGILKGSGLAIWSDLFPRGRIIGLDIDLQHTRANMENLKHAGAFRHGDPELHEFDQLQENSNLLKTILGNDKISVFIDDGLHSRDSILTTLQSVLPHLSERFVYFIEDNRRVHTEIRERFPAMKVVSSGKMTVLHS